MEKTNITDKINKIKYAYFDLDGTLLNDAKEISDLHLKAIEKLKSLGIKVGIATGRPYYLALDIIDKIKPDLPTISINGNLIYDQHTKEITPIKPHSKEFISQFMIFAKNHKLNYLAYKQDGIYYKEYLPSKHLAWIKNLRKNQELKFKTPLFPLENNDDFIYKFLITLKDSEDYSQHKVEEFIENIKDVYMVTSQTGLLDLMPKDVTKASGLKFLAKQGIIDLRNIIVFGDSHNDIPMLELATVSVAMANSSVEVKNKADIVTTKTNDQNGLWRFINDIF